MEVRKITMGFLKFLGDEKPLVGSPFQIDFPEEKDHEGNDDSTF